MSFESQIKEWVRLDNELRIYNEKIRQIREKKSQIVESLKETNTFSEQLNNKTINISDGKLKFSNTKVTSPITFKYIDATLKKIIRNEEQVGKIIQYLKENREFKLVPEIKRFS